MTISARIGDAGNTTLDIYSGSVLIGKIEKIGIESGLDRCVYRWTACFTTDEFHELSDDVEDAMSGLVNRWKRWIHHAGLHEHRGGAGQGESSTADSLGGSASRRAFIAVHRALSAHRDDIAKLREMVQAGNAQSAQA